MTQLDQFLAALVSHLGWNYHLGPTRCTGVDHYHDCSGYVSFGLVACGARPHGYCSDSSTIAGDIINAHTRIARDDCRRMPGTVAIRPRANSIIPGVGHIVVSAGIIDGVARTYEAHSSASGVVMGYFDGPRQFATFGKLPGLVGYGSPAATPTIPKGTGMAWMQAATPSGHGYWEVDAAGHVYAYGDANYYGGAGWKTPSGVVVQPVAPIIGMASTPKGNGYWLCDALGHIYTFGSAPYLGGQGWRMPDGTVVDLHSPASSFVACPTGGYWITNVVGQVYAFGGAPRPGDPYGNPNT